MLAMEKDLTLERLETCRWCAGRMGGESASWMSLLIALADRGEIKPVDPLPVLGVGLGRGLLLYEVGSSTGGVVLSSTVALDQ